MSSEKVEISNIAREAARENPKEVLEKAKELGFKVRSVKSKVTSEQAEVLYNYVTTGTLPDDFVPATEKTNKDSKNQEESKTETYKQEPKTKKTIKNPTIHKQNTKTTSVSIETDSIKQISQADISKPKRAIQIISNGEDKKEVQKEPVEISKATTQHQIVQSKHDIQDAQKQVAGSIRSITQEVKEDYEVPQGIDISRIRKPRISAIRVVSKNDDNVLPHKNDDLQATLRSSTRILDSLKHVERKDRVKKKKEKTSNASFKALSS